jgi:hypothetical protein
MAHALKADFVFRRNGRVHLNQQGRQFSRLLAAELCALAVVMLDTPCSEVVWRVLATYSIRQFPLHFPSRASPCAITFQLDSMSIRHVTIACSNSVARLTPSVTATRIFTLAISTAALHPFSLHYSPAVLSLRSRIFRDSNQACCSDAAPCTYALGEQTLTVAFLSRLASLMLVSPIWLSVSLRLYRPQPFPSKSLPPYHSCIYSVFTEDRMTFAHKTTNRVWPMFGIYMLQQCISNELQCSYCGTEFQFPELISGLLISFI